MSGVLDAAAGFVRAATGRDNGNRQPMRDADFGADTYASNLLGLDRASVVATKLQMAFEDPGAYYKLRNKALADLREVANKTFLAKFNSLRLEAYSDEECKQRASTYCQAVMAAEIAEFEASYPLDVTNIAASLTARKSKAGQGLMSVENSATLAIPGSRRGGRGGRKSKK